MPSAPYYPLFLDLVQKPVLVVGGGAVALRKTKSLIESAARVTVVSPEIHPGFDKLADIERIIAPYAATHMARKMWRLVFAATSVTEVNATVQRHAAAAGIFCCRADDPEEGDFTSGANVHIGATRRADGRGVQGAGNVGGIIVAIATNGASPVLAARLCKEMAANVDPLLPKLADMLADWRPTIKQTVTDAHIRRALLQRMASEELETILRREGAPAARQAVQRWLAEAQEASAPKEPAPQPTPGKSARVLKHAD